MNNPNPILGIARPYGRRSAESSPIALDGTRRSELVQDRSALLGGILPIYLCHIVRIT